MLMDINSVRQSIFNGETVLGIELGSTRIKGVLLDKENRVLATGGFSWENRLENGVWTYHLDEVWTGLQNCYQELAETVKREYGVELEHLGAIGISAMMHGYLVFDEQDRLLTPFRTWRNTMTEAAAQKLTALFDHQIPQRWSIAHLYQSVLDQLEHIEKIRYMTTLSGYVHWMLTGERVLGVDDASGMFPVDPDTKDYYSEMLDKFDDLVAANNYPWKLRQILPKVLCAGENAGVLTQTGAKLLDPTGKLRAGIPMCPPAGDAGTGMVATNSVKVRTGNVSAGTSIFSMIVLEKALSRVYPEIDIVTTPEGNSVAMVHCNNCTSDLNGWVGLFREFARSFGMEMDEGRLFEGLFRKALEADADCGGLLNYNYLSGEHITGFSEGRPLFVREPSASFTLANFMRTQLYSCLATLKLGSDLLIQKEGVGLDSIQAHGGLFKTPQVGQKLLAAALQTPVCVMNTAGEGGAWGVAVLAGYMLWKNKESLSDYLENRVFANAESTTVQPDPQDVEGFQTFMSRYERGLPIERAAIDTV